MSTLIYTSKQCRIVRYCGGRNKGVCLDIIPSQRGTKIEVRSIAEAERIITALKDFINYRKQGKKHENFYKNYP